MAQGGQLWLSKFKNLYVDKSCTIFTLVCSEMRAIADICCKRCHHVFVSN